MEKEVRDSLEQCIGMFFASQQAFEMHTKNVEGRKVIKCPKCHGRRHSNLYLAGAKEPVSCGNCGGKGTIQSSHVDAEVGTGTDVYDLDGK